MDEQKYPLCCKSGEERLKSKIGWAPSITKIAGRLEASETGVAAGVDTIFVIRHAEKPHHTTVGINQKGKTDPKALTVQGWERAGALAVFFGSTQGLPAPTRIYASDPGKQWKRGSGDNSERPFQTVSALATKLGIKTNLSYGKREEHNLAGELVGLRGITLVCWQHEAIPDIARGILGTAKGIPPRWPSDRFDVVWRFIRSGNDAAWKFDQICPQLLPGDQPKPISLGDK